MSLYIGQISDNQADLIKSFAIFFLLLVGNYVGNTLFTCYQIKFINLHARVQLFIAFLLFYFLVTLISDTGKKEFIPPIQKLIYTFFYFIGFLLVMRLDIKITFVVLLLIFALYFLELNQDFYTEGGNNITNQKDKQIYNDNLYWITFDWPVKIRLFPVKKSHFVFINKIETVMYYLIIVLLIFGFISYGGEVKETIQNSKTKITWIEVISDSKICKFKNKKSFWEYFKIGLGLPI
jgi:hypothetical protein